MKLTEQYEALGLVRAAPCLVPGLNSRTQTRVLLAFHPRGLESELLVESLVCRTRHPFVLELVDCRPLDQTILLVYEYLSHSLFQFLGENTPKQWLVGALAAGMASFKDRILHNSLFSDSIRICPVRKLVKFYNFNRAKVDNCSYIQSQSRKQAAFPCPYPVQSFDRRFTCSSDQLWVLGLKLLQFYHSVSQRSLCLLSPPFKYLPLQLYYAHTLPQLSKFELPSEQHFGLLQFMKACLIEDTTARAGQVHTFVKQVSPVPFMPPALLIIISSLKWRKERPREQSLIEQAFNEQPRAALQALWGKELVSLAQQLRDKRRLDNLKLVWQALAEYNPLLEKLASLREGGSAE